MSLDYWGKKFIKELLHDSDKRLTHKIDKGFNAVAESLKQLNQRLDVMEQAIADPQSDAADALRKKHGMGKRQPTKPLTTVRKAE